tara:strand:+ start:499 stop:693 length:195 start_codon:yes stop_codon:yes gene_type:complete
MTDDKNKDTSKDSGSTSKTTSTEGFKNPGQISTRSADPNKFANPGQVSVHLKVGDIFKPGGNKK